MLYLEKIKTMKVLVNATILSIFFFLNSCDSSIQNKAENSTQPLDVRLLNQINSLKGNPFENYRNDISLLEAEVMMFESIRFLINEADSSHSKEIIKLKEELKTLLIKSQKREYPLMRKAYLHLIYEKFWEQNIETELIGKKKSIIEFTGYHFADNINIKTIHNSVKPILNILRFKEVRYLWAKGEEYTYFKLKNPDDGAVGIEFNQLIKAD